MLSAHELLAFLPYLVLIITFDHVCAVNSVCPKHMTRCAVGYVGLYSVSDTNGHENDCCTALTL